MLENALEENSLITLPDLLQLETREHELFYPASWSLVTFLIERTDGGSGGSLATYWGSLRKSSFPRNVFWEVFGQPQTLEEEWKKFIGEIIDDPAIRWRISHQKL